MICERNLEANPNIGQTWKPKGLKGDTDAYLKF